jgi:preprotein translocase subunit YajC
MSSSLFPLILIVLAVLLLVVLPGRQRKRQAAAAQSLQESLTPGTPVMTTSGIHGSVARVGDTTIDLEIAPGVVATFERRAVLQVRPPAVPAPPAADGAEFPGPGVDLGKGSTAAPGSTVELPDDDPRRDDGPSGPSGPSGPAGPAGRAR